MRTGDRKPRQRLAPDERRTAILQSAAAAFAAAPYGAVSVAAIAEAAGTSEALVYRYFDGKPGLYAELIQLGTNQLWHRQESAAAQLPPNSPVRDRVRVSLEIYLDHIAESATAWAAPFLVAGNDPPAALAVRQRERAAYVDRLRAVLRPQQGARHEYALHGYFGFLDGACLAWVTRGCPPDERDALMDAALGALEGALGDWDA